jgi:hypothetical protein
MMPIGIIDRKLARADVAGRIIENGDIHIGPSPPDGMSRCHIMIIETVLTISHTIIVWNIHSCFRSR